MAMRTEVNGIPTLVGPSVNGRCTGGFVFRVGQADESLSTSGITHLVEHLALHFSDPTKLHSNGHTGVTLTNFHISGERHEVVQFLNSVAASLREIPLDRLATEKGILRTEAQRRGGGADGIHAWRYGARDYGLSSFSELGLYRITGEDVTDWVSRWFTRGNAMAWLATDDVPPGLDLSLPDGERQPTPPVVSALPEVPSFYLGPDGVIAASGVIRRSTAGSVFASVLEQGLFHELRRVGGYSYSPAAAYDPIDGATAGVFAFADALPENQGAVVGGLIDVLAQLRAGTLPDDAISATVAQRRAMFTHPDAETMRMPSDTANELLGKPSPSNEKLLAELEAVDASAIAAVAQEFHRTSLLQVPGRSIEWAGYTPAPVRNGIGAHGPGHTYIDYPQTAIHLDDAAVAVVVADQEPSGVQWSELAAVKAWPDGARTAIGRDGFEVHVEPTLLVNGGQLPAAIDARVAADLMIPMPARLPDDIPQPTLPAPQPRATAPAKRRWFGKKDHA